MRFLRAVLALLCIVQPLSAQNQNPAPPVIRGWEALVMLGVTGGAMAIDQSARGLLRRQTQKLPSILVRAGDALGNVRYLGPALFAGILSGIAVSDTGWEAVGTRAFESTALSAAAALVLKSAIGRRRPDIAPNTPFSFRPFAFKGNSFPSGHTALAFALATSLASETKDHWTDALFYAGGTLTAFARINDDKHWLSDTVFGAVIGIVSARLVQHWSRKSTAQQPVVSLRFSF